MPAKKPRKIKKEPLTPGQISKFARKAGRAGWHGLTPEEKYAKASIGGKALAAKLTTRDRRVRAKKGWGKKSREEREAIVKKGWKNLSKDARHARAKKGWETRLRNRFIGMESIRKTLPEIKQIRGIADPKKRMVSARKLMKKVDGLIKFLETIYENSGREHSLEMEKRRKLIVAGVEEEKNITEINRLAMEKNRAEKELEELRDYRSELVPLLR